MVADTCDHLKEPARPRYDDARQKQSSQEQEYRLHQLLHAALSAKGALRRSLQCYQADGAGRGEWHKLGH